MTSPELSAPPAASPSRFRSGLLLTVLVTAAFLAALAVPYRVDTDTGFQLRSLQQWVRGESPNPGTLRLPDPDDLSRDRLVWSTWWPPGFPFLYAPLAAAGLSISATLRITSFLLFLAGSAGWLRLADGLDLSRPVLALYAVSLAAYALTLGGASGLRSADVLAFAFAPWLAVLALRQGGGETSARRLFLGGLAFGTSYWLKYTLFLVALPLAGWLAARAAFAGNGPAGRRAGRLAALGLGCALPVAALFALNLSQTDSLAETATGSRSAWQQEAMRTAEPLPLALSLVGAPGLGLFQNHLWITHLVYFSDARLPALGRLDIFERLMLRALLGLPATAALLWGLARERGNQPRRYVSLALTATAGFYAMLTLASVVVRYNYLANEPRFALGVLPLLYPLALAGWLSRRAGSRPYWAAIPVLALCFAAPLAFAVTNFAKNEIRDRALPGYTASATGLFTPELSTGSTPAVQAVIAAVVRSPRDVIVLAGPAGWGSSFVMWLELPGRILPVGTFPAPLGPAYLDAAELRGSKLLRSSQSLRVVLVASRSLAADALAPLKARFPQAGVWQGVPLPPGAKVSVSFSDLEVR